MIKDWGRLKDYALVVGFLLQTGLTVYLLVSCQYVSLSDSHFEASLGLYSLEIDEDRISYSSYSHTCRKSESLCDSIPKISTAGAILLLCLCISTVLEAMTVVQVWFGKWLLSIAVKRVYEGKGVPRWLCVCTKAGKVVQMVGLFDPLVLLVGLVLWVVVSDVDGLSRHFHLCISSSFICYILRVLLSLLATSTQLLFYLHHSHSNSLLLSDTSPKSSVIHTDKPCLPSFTCED